MGRVTFCLFHAAPGRDEFVVYPSIVGPAFALAQGVEAVGERTDGFGAAGHASEQRTGGGFAVLVQRAGQHVGLAILAGGPALLFEPVQAELGVGVEVVFGQKAVDELQRGGSVVTTRTTCPGSRPAIRALGVRRSSSSMALAYRLIKAMLQSDATGR